MLAETSLHKRAGWSLMLFGLAWLIAAFDGDWTKRQFDFDPISVIAGVGLVVVGFRIKNGRVESAKSGIGCMWAVLLLTGGGIILLSLGYFGLLGNGWSFTA